MYLNEQSKAQVRPRDFWLAVLVVTLVLGVIGLSAMQTGHLPTASHWMITVYHGFAAALLLFLWTAFVVRWVRKSRRVYTLRNVTSLVGCTLIFGSDLIPPLGHAADWAKNIGVFLIFLTILPDFITFGKRPPTVPPVNLPNQPTP